MVDNVWRKNFHANRRIARHHVRLWNRFWPPLLSKQVNLVIANTTFNKQSDRYFIGEVNGGPSVG